MKRNLWEDSGPKNNYTENKQTNQETQRVAVTKAQDMCSQAGDAAS